MIKVYQSHYGEADYDLLAQVTNIEADNAIKERCQLFEGNCGNCEARHACADLKRLAAYILNKMYCKD